MHDLRRGQVPIVPENGKLPLVQVAFAHVKIARPDAVILCDPGAVHKKITVANVHLFARQPHYALDDQIPSIPYDYDVASLRITAPKSTLADQQQIARLKRRPHALSDHQVKAELRPQECDTAQRRDPKRELTM